ncbi:CBS domain-containing protein [Motilimonas cestriensis]|uniref:CBS domain-containing protein n=1 Tax=Motilimonas cestriensis TaxID=2742685 RepID=A0ABS8W7B4_9GAMM|nr:CBS domain-containing protein [Motilimonas cestriensis]MCE2594879.1 CBS domain-containing protein [Motilimonas cestriensis]
MELLTIASYMNKRPVTFRVDDPVAHAVEKLLRSNQIGGPVLDAEKKVIGWISEQDCLKKMIESSYHCESAALVEDMMRTDVLSLPANASILDVAQQMLQPKPKAYPVVDEGRLVGIITRRDILKAIDVHLSACYVKTA